MQRKLNDLKPHGELLEIRPENSEAVSRYRQAMRQGEKFPPLIITSDNTIVDGNQRYFAYLKEFDETDFVDVEIQDYETEIELIADSVRINTRHGHPLTGFSRRKALTKLLELGMNHGQLAELFGVSAQRVESIAGETVVVQGKRKPFKPRGITHMKGKKMTKEQYDTHTKEHKAMDVSRECKQLVEWLGWGWVDLEDEQNTQALQELAQAIDSKLGVLV